MSEDQYGGESRRRWRRSRCLLSQKSYVLSTAGFAFVVAVVAAWSVVRFPATSHIKIYSFLQKFSLPLCNSSPDVFTLIRSLCDLKSSSLHDQKEGPVSTSLFDTTVGTEWKPWCCMIGCTEPGTPACLIRKVRETLLPVWTVYPSLFHLSAHERRIQFSRTRHRRHRQ